MLEVLEEFEDILEHIGQRNKPVRLPKRYIRDAENPMEMFQEGEFKKRYRFSKASVNVTLLPLVIEGLQKPISGNSSTKDTATPVVAKEFTNSCSTTTSKGVVAKKGKVLPEEKLKRSRLVETAHQQQELHNLKKLIAEEELLRVKEERKLLAQRGEVIELDLRRAAVEHQRAADEAELALLKLKQFKKVMLSEDP